MSNLKLRQLRIGKVDGKHEWLTPTNQREEAAFDAFLIPSSVDPARMHNGDVIFISGFRGTGKTSLLRWHAEQQRRLKHATDIVLFKSDLTEQQRANISNEVGVSWTDVDSKAMEFSQDFKDSWAWFILHKIGENLKRDPDLYEDYDSSVPKILKLLGLGEESPFRKMLGYMPKLEAASIKLKADLQFFEAELGGDFKKDGEFGKVTLNALVSRVRERVLSLEFRKSLFIYFDELEAFYHSPEQHRRDQRLVRDLLFSIGNLSDLFRARSIPIHIIAAVRSEVVSAFGTLGQEVDRLVHDRGTLISWHHAKRSVTHPLFEIVRRKLNISEKLEGITPSSDPVAAYLPAAVNGEPIDEFMLDKSFYKPRDIVWRLSIAQQLFPEAENFKGDVLRETEIDYSNKLWDEVRYELGATYSDDEVDMIEGVISGGAASFDISQIQEKFDKVSHYSQKMGELLYRRSVREIMHDLYRLGAIGNSFRIGTSGNTMRNRWAFRGDPKLLDDKRMVIHPALNKRLSTVASRRRGHRGGVRQRS